jgi:hypothetical protein
VLKVLFLLALLALAIYLVVRSVQGRGSVVPKRKPLQRRPPSRPLAPDDDPDVLRDLDRKRKHPDDPEGV